MKTAIFHCLLLLLITSCTTVNVTNRKGKDIPLSEGSAELLSGKYLNKTPDPLSTYRRYLWRELNAIEGPIDQPEGSIVLLKAVSGKKLISCYMLMKY